MEIFCTTNHKATFCQNIEFCSIKSSSCNYWCNLSTSQEKLLDELGLGTLKSQRWLRRLCYLYKIINIGIIKYLADLIPKCEIGYNIRNRNNPFLIAKLKVLKINFSHILLKFGIN